MQPRGYDKTNHIEMRGLLQWNPVNTDTKGTYHNARIIWLSVLSGLSEKKKKKSPGRMFIDLTIKADILPKILIS